jgi:hypothetical protein
VVSLKAFGEIAGGGQPTTVGERTGKNSLPYALVYLPEERSVFLREWYREFHRKWIYKTTTS